MQNEEKFQVIRDTIEGVHEHIESEFSDKAFSVWIFGTPGKVTTMISKPDDVSFARETMTAALMSNELLSDLILDAQRNASLAQFDGDELVFDRPVDRKQVLKEFNEIELAVFKIIEAGLKHEDMSPDDGDNVKMDDIANHCLPIIQRKLKMKITECLRVLSMVMEDAGCEAEQDEVNFSNSIFKWQKN